MRYGFACAGKLSFTLLNYLVQKGYKPSALIIGRNCSKLDCADFIKISGLPNTNIICEEYCDSNSNVEMLNALNLDFAVTIESQVTDLLSVMVRQGILCLETRYDDVCWRLPERYSHEPIAFYPLHSKNLAEDLLLLYNLHLEGRSQLKKCGTHLSSIRKDNTPSTKMYLIKLQRVENWSYKSQNLPLKVNGLLTSQDGSTVLSVRNRSKSLVRCELKKRRELKRLILFLQDLCFHVQMRAKMPIVTSSINDNDLVSTY